MKLVSLDMAGFKSFAKKTTLTFDQPITAIVGPNGSGKSNVAEAFRWVLGEQSLKSLRGKRGEDLIFNGSESNLRPNRAMVSVTFDNQDKKLNLDYDQVVITRVVHRDGVNEYLLNGSVVRLKDILELLSNASLGPSGHHIISQGEADRILNSSPRERKEMIEEALGLKAYQWKINESERKLIKTEININQVESLRREIAPHIKFLKKQVDKIAQAEELRRELKRLYSEYLSRESVYLKAEKEAIDNGQSGPRQELVAVERQLAEKESILTETFEDDGWNEKIVSLEKAISENQKQQDDLSRKIGRLEGMIEVKQEAINNRPVDESIFTLSETSAKISEIEAKINSVVESTSVEALRDVLLWVKNHLRVFLDTKLQSRNKNDISIDELKTEKQDLEATNLKLVETAHELNNQLISTRSLLATKKDEVRGAEREVFELRAKRSELNSKLESFRSRQERLNLAEEDLKREIEEGLVLTDREILNFKDQPLAFDINEPRSQQEGRRRVIEKMKIRLEDMGVESGDVIKEYREVTERDEFLAKELSDLEKAAISLRQIMSDLSAKIDEEFKSGLVLINTEFQNFFSLMFGGGTASLCLEKTISRRKKDTAVEFDLPDGCQDEVADDEGIEINVSLPRKKIKGLMMLSGGERALTSIALLFAMTQVNPPPFLILDETDAALDETNSRKYGDMIFNLSKRSQLILITHNRETMSRADTLFGVTMGRDGISRLLSIRLTEAESYAK